MLKLTRKTLIILLATGVLTVSAAGAVSWWLFSGFEDKVLVLGTLGLMDRDENYYYLEGRKFCHLGDYRRGLECFNKAISFAPQGEWILFKGLYQLRAEANEKLGQHELAVIDAKKEIELYNNQKLKVLRFVGPFDEVYRVPEDGIPGKIPRRFQPEPQEEWDLEYCKMLVGQKRAGG